MPKPPALPVGSLKSQFGAAQCCILQLQSSTTFAAKGFFPLFFPSSGFQSLVCGHQDLTDSWHVSHPHGSSDSRPLSPLLPLPGHHGWRPVGRAAFAGKSTPSLFLEPEKPWHTDGSSRSQEAQMVLNVRERCKRIWETACPGAMRFHRQQLQSQHPAVFPLLEPVTVPGPAGMCPWDGAGGLWRRGGPRAGGGRAGDEQKRKCALAPAASVTFSAPT